MLFQYIKVSQAPGSSKSSGFGFVTFSSEEEVQAATSSFNDTVRLISHDPASWNSYCGYWYLKDNYFKITKENIWNEIE
jgi:RNA recognition motif. (a.k.a. RRM, RBD, or RNP domain)